MSCNGCRVLRKGCNEGCILRPCLVAIDGPEAQGHATLFLAKFFGRAGLMGFISAVQEAQRAALFQSLLFEACGRTINPVYGSAGLLWSGQWHTCEAAVETVLQSGSLQNFNSSRSSLPGKSCLQSSISPLPPVDPPQPAASHLTHSNCASPYPNYRVPIMMENPMSFWPMTMGQMSAGGIPMTCTPVSSPYGPTPSAFAAFRGSFQHSSSCQGASFLPGASSMHGAGMGCNGSMIASQPPVGVNNAMGMALPMHSMHPCPVPMSIPPTSNGNPSSCAAASPGMSPMAQYLQSPTGGCMSPVSGMSGISSNSAGNSRGVESRGSPGNASTCGSPPLVAPVARRIVPQQRGGNAMHFIPGISCAAQMAHHPMETSGFVLSDAATESVGSPGEIEVADMPFPMETWNPIEERSRTLLPLLS